MQVKNRPKTTITKRKQKQRNQSKLKSAFFSQQSNK